MADQLRFLPAVSRRWPNPTVPSPLQKLLSIPYSGPLAENVPLTPALLRLDPMFDPLRMIRASKTRRLAHAEVIVAVGEAGTPLFRGMNERRPAAAATVDLRGTIVDLVFI
jgi:hypothetical protein